MVLTDKTNTSVVIETPLIKQFDWFTAYILHKASEISENNWIDKHKLKRKEKNKCCRRGSMCVILKTL